MEEKKVRVREGNTNARKEKWEGEEYQNPSSQLYHENENLSSTPKRISFIGMGIKEKNCAWCGKNFCPTPEWALGDCCKPTCKFRYDDYIRDSYRQGREVIMLNPETNEQIIKFESAKIAGEQLGIDPRRIRLACNGLAERAGNYAWIWADDMPIQPAKSVPETVEERKMSITVRIRESLFARMKAQARVADITVTELAREIIEKEMLKEN